MVRALLGQADRVGRTLRKVGCKGHKQMANGARGNGDPDHRPAEEAQLSARLRRLGEQLGKRGARPPSDDPSMRSAAERSAMARGLRLSSELVAGVLVGAAMGWLIDRWLGISPFGLIVFLLLGFAAGVVNVIRAAGVGPSGDGPSGDGPSGDGPSGDGH